MNESEKIVNTVGICVIAFIAAPIILNAVTTVIGYTYGAVANLGNRIVFNHKMNKEVKEGTAVKIDGDYYKVEPIVEA